MSAENDLRKQKKVSANVVVDTSGISTEAKQDDQIDLATDLNDLVDGLEGLLTFIEANTSGVNLESTQLLVKAALDLIKSKTDNIDVALSSRLNTLGQKLMASSAPVVIASDQSAVPTSRTWQLSDGDMVSIANFPAFQNVVVTESALPTNAATASKQDKLATLVGERDEAAAGSDTAESGLNGLIKRLLQKTSMELKYGATAAVTSVSASVTSVTLIASSATRKQVIIENTSANKLWISYVNPAALSKGFSLAKNEKLIEDNYRGTIYGIWETSATGNAQVTQVTT